jgi:hypothetical protein
MELKVYLISLEHKGCIKSRALPPDFQPKSLGGQGFQDKVARGFPYFGFYCIIINEFKKFVWGLVFHPPPIYAQEPDTV